MRWSRRSARLLARAHELTDDGLRVLAVATAVRPARHRDYTPADERGLTFEGFVTLRDALVPSAAEALRVLADQGVAVRVLTGDHPGTAARVCRDLGLDPGEVRTAADLDGLTDTELGEVADRTTVLARCTPEHKARITVALRARGHATGYLGDGVNDLPALHAADVGICPRDATDLARESADVVLADKDLTAISHAITAGRYSSGNIGTYLRVTLSSSNLGNVIAMLAAGILLPFLPMLPTQVLVQNMCFDAAQLAFAYDRPAPGTLKRPTVLRSRDAGFHHRLRPAERRRRPRDLRRPRARRARARDGERRVRVPLRLVHREPAHPGPGDAPAAARPPGHRGPVETGSRSGWGATALTAAGLALPLSPLGPPLGMTALPALYYLLLVAVLGLYAVGLVATRSRYGTPSLRGRRRDLPQ